MKYIMCSRTFPKGHPRQGEQTHFVEKVLMNLLITEQISHSKCAELAQQVFDKSHPMYYIDTLRRYDCSPLKGHTIRAGSRYKPGETVSLRVWSGRPYQSNQIEFAQVEVKKTWDIEISEFWFINGCIMEHDQVMELVKNDGLSYDDFVKWFNKHPKKKGDVFRGQIICWGDAIEYGKPYLLTEKQNHE